MNTNREKVAEHSAPVLQGQETPKPRLLVALPDLAGPGDAHDAAGAPNAPNGHEAVDPPGVDAAAQGEMPSLFHKRHLLRGWRDRIHQVLQNEDGAVTAEYAIIIMAAVAFAGVLVAIIRSEQIREMLVKLVENALGSAG